MMNKKYLAFGFMGLFVVALAAAAIVEYYGAVEQDVEIVLPITLEGNPTEVMTGFSGTTFTGEDITIVNSAPFDVDVVVSNDAPEGIDVEYTGTTMLTMKTVVFGDAPWTATGEPIAVEYTVVGDSFNAEVTTPIAGYELVYYKDNSDRFNDPADAIAVGDVVGNLPYESDGNADEYDMCDIEVYDACHGAKIWYVPSDAVTEGVIDWSRASEFYFETNLIQYNAEGDITMFGETELTVTPVYDVASNYVGSDTITTTVA